MVRSLKLCTLLRQLSCCGQRAMHYKSGTISNIHNASLNTLISHQKYGRDIQVYKQWDVEGVTWTIEDLNPDDYPAIEPLIMQLFREVNLSVRIGVDKDEDALLEIAKYFSGYVKDRVSLVCCRTYLGKKEIAAFNLSSLMSIEHPPIKYTKIESQGCRTMIGIFDYLYSLVDAYNVLNVNKYLGFGALFVVPQFRGQKISNNIIAARKLMCRRFGIPASVGLMASVKSERAAERAGFKTLLEISFADLAKAGFSFPGGQTGRLKVMAKVFADDDV